MWMDPVRNQHFSILNMKKIVLNSESDSPCFLYSSICQDLCIEPNNNQWDLFWACQQSQSIAEETNISSAQMFIRIEYLQVDTTIISKQNFGSRAP